MVGVAEREVVGLDREDVREVVADLDGEVELDPAGRVVRDDEVLLHRVADEALAGDRDLVVRQVAHHRVPQEERGRVVLDLAGREHQRARPVDGQHPAREEARVVGEEPHRRLGDVAELVGDAERRALEDR